jgi:hypothetical protein
MAFDTLRQQNLRHDEKLFAAYQNFIAAYNDWKKSEESVGAFASQTVEFWNSLLRAEKAYKKLEKK